MDHSGTDLLLVTLPGLDVVDRVDLTTKIPRVRGVSPEGRKISTENVWRPARRL